MKLKMFLNCNKDNNKTIKTSNNNNNYYKKLMVTKLNEFCKLMVASKAS